MNTDDIVLAVIDFLNEHDIPYMLVGSLATNWYCVPRSTEDGDIVVQTDLTKLAFAIKRKCATIHFVPQLEFESITATRKVVLETEGHGFQVELFSLSDDEHDQLRFSRRQQVEAMGKLVWVASLEDMIVTKLRWSQHAGREKDISDARNLIGVQNANINWLYVESWCERHGTRDALNRLRRETSST